MFDVFERTRYYEPELWAAVTEGRILCIYVPVNINLFSNPLLRKLTTRAVAFGSVLIEDSQEGQRALEELLRQYSRQAKKKAIFTELRNVMDLSDLRLFINKTGFYFENHLNYLIYLDRNSDCVFRKIGPRTRKNIKRAIKKNIVHLESVDNLDKLEECYNLLENTYKKAAVPLADRTLFEAAFEILLPKGMLKITLARVHGNAAAVSFDLLYKKTMLGWYGGLDRRFRAYMPNEVLTWELLRWGCENGFELYDFGGAGRPSQKYGVRDFKAKFGGQQVDYGRFKNIHSNLLYRTGVFFYEILRPSLLRMKLGERSNR
jgi:lipid II:glycine glycyltransferase (peptidoglycan interpeptide bridge formation enzyme)